MNVASLFIMYTMSLVAFVHALPCRNTYNSFNCFQNYPEDSVREEMRRLLDEKCQYETTAKESLRRVLQEKLDAAAKLADLERWGVVSFE